VYRTLRFQLIASVVVTVVSGLGLSQWLSTRLSEQALEEDLRDRAAFVADTVSTLWEGGNRKELHQQLTTLVGGQRAISAVDILRVQQGRWTVSETTRAEETSRPALSERDAALVAADQPVRVPLADGSSGWRLVVPVKRSDSVVGAVQVEVRPAEFRQLQRWLRILDGIVLVGSIVLVSLVLAFLLERRVTRPVTALVGAMRRAEAGDLSARADVPTGGDFEFLARRFNGMVTRVGELTTGLEARVTRATRDLASKNRELQAANEQLAAAQLEVARAERLAAYGQMAATIAHELGTPLNSVLGYTQLLLRDEPAAERAEKLAIIESQVQRMADTIRDVLGRARDQALARAPVAVDLLVAESLTFVSPRIDSRNLVVRTEIPNGLPPVVGDATALRQVLINLLTNAIDATEPPGTITVRAARGSDDGSHEGYVELVVSDTGVGMTAEQLRRAREPFYTTKAAGRGTGLGLVIVDHIVRAHRGRFLMESRPGHGSTMHVQLPLET
jgi:two-component system NtrC family sensor kinase